MNLIALSNTLPNGFHDAEVQSFEMDYVSRDLRFLLDVWIGDIAGAGGGEVYRSGILTLHGVAYLVVEPPDPKYAWLEECAIRIDTGPGRTEKASVALPEAPPGTVASWFYLSNFNSFLHCAAAEAELDWTGEARVREHWAK
jgi:hypothetical protein